MLAQNTPAFINKENYGKKKKSKKKPSTSKKMKK